MYICPLFKEVKSQQEDYRGYRSDDPSLQLLKKVHQVKDGVRNVQVTPIVEPSILVFRQTGHVHH